MEKYKIKELDEELRPRTRAKKYGFQSLSDDELLAIILRCGTKNHNVKEIATNILSNAGGLTELANKSVEELKTTPGVGEVGALSIMAAIELGKRCLSTKKEKTKLTNAKIVYDSFKYDFKGLTQEKVVGVFLDNASQLISYKTIFCGTVNKSLVHPREIFKEAIRSSASSIILLHNHPSGNLNPSPQDRELTKNLIAIGKTMSIPILDHIIISDNGYYSFNEKMIIEE